MKREYRPLSKSPLVTKLWQSGTGVIEGNYKSSLGLDDMESNEKMQFSVHLSDFAGNYLGKYYLRLNISNADYISCELLISEGGKVYNQLKRFGDSINIILLPFKHFAGGYAGRFIADWGNSTAEVSKDDLTL